MCKESETHQNTTGTQSQTSTTSNPGYVNDAAQNLVHLGENVGNSSYTPYTGQMVAPTTSDQNNAFQMIRNLISGAPQVGPDAIKSAQAYGSAPAQSVTAHTVNGQKVGTERVVDENGRLGKIADYMNPYTDQALNPALRKIQEASAQIDNQNRARATAAHAFGDARHGIVDAQNNKNTVLAVGDTSGKYLTDAYNAAMAQRTADLQRMLGADTTTAQFGQQANLANQQAQNQADVTNANFQEQALGRQLAGANATETLAGADQNRLLQQIQQLLNAGQIQQSTGQAQDSANYQEFMNQYNHQFAALNALRGALQGLPSERTVTTTGSSTGQTTNTQPDNSLLGGLGSAAGAYAGSTAGSAAITALLAGL